MPEQIPVRVRDCACPGQPHADEGDIVYLASMIGMDGGVEAESDIVAASGDERKLRRLLLRTFVTYGVTGWNLVDEAGEPVPLDLEAIIADWRLARPVGDAAADLYTETIASPFLTAQPARSPTGPTEPTTSRTRRPTKR